MTLAQAEGQSFRKPLRLWPGVVAVVLQWLFRFAVPVVFPESVAIGIIGSLVGGIVVIVWWLFFSRAPWSERLGAVALMITAMLATSLIIDKSIATGAQGMLFPVLAIPGLSLALVFWAVATRNFAVGPRRAALVVAVLAASGVWALVKTAGFTGDFQNDLSWRWTKTPEERLLAQTGEALTVPPPAAAPAATPKKVDTPEPSPASGTPSAKIPNKAVPPPPPPAPESETMAEWGGFRGPHRDGIVAGVTIDTNWTNSPPAKLWGRPVGPGWSSFAVHGDFIYTQEQRGAHELVSCYRLSTGEPVWTHRDTARFWESNAGAGPRSTPTLGRSRVYTFGATGILNVLNARDGSVVWTRNAAVDTTTKVPDWGFSGSPLLSGDTVIVAVSGQLVAYDIATGTPRWFGPRGGPSYSSPHRMMSNGVTQILFLNAGGATSVDATDGKLLWEHAWKGYPIVQPALTADGDILISVTDSGGTRRLGVARGSEGWIVQERWTSNGLKPYFNDFVVHQGHAFGFDGNILSCIDLNDGKRKWKGGRYGNGQLLLLRDQDLLLVISEQGELVLVKATPGEFAEVARAPAIEGKTWNHPALVGNILLVRNSEQMAAFRLTPAGGTQRSSTAR